MRRERGAALPRQFEEVVSQIVAQIEHGTRPWEAPWIGGDGPRNHLTLRHYTGINEPILISAAYNMNFPHHRWLTVKQAEAMGGRVKDGARGTTIVVGLRYFSRAEDRRSMRENRVSRSSGFSRLYTVYNIAQCEGVRPMPTPPRPSRKHISSRIEALVAAIGISVRFGGVNAFYDSGDDFIQMPPQTAFFEPAAYYRTLLHEVAHALMGPHRMNVILPGLEPGERRVWAEIVAELVSAFVCRVMAITFAVRPADYIGEWLSSLRSIRRVVAVDPLWIREGQYHACDVAAHLLSYEGKRPTR